jgi:hypothetical protein
MDLGDLEKIITKVATAKGFVIVLVLALTAFFVYRNFDFISKVTLEVAPRAPESKSKVSKDRARVTGADIQFRRLQLPPIQTDLPSYLFAEFRNGRDIAATNVEIALDLGAAKAERVSIRPTDRCDISQANLGSLIRVKCGALGGYESIYIHAVTSAPQLRGAVVSVEGISSMKPLRISQDGEFVDDVTLWDGLLWILKWGVLLTFGMTSISLGFTVILIAFSWCEAAYDRLSGKTH